MQGKATNMHWKCRGRNHALKRKYLGDRAGQDLQSCFREFKVTGGLSSVVQ